MSKIKRSTSENVILVLGITVICLIVAVIVLVVISPHNNPDDIINYPLDANQMAIENTMDRGMVEQPVEVYQAAFTADR